MQIALLSDDSFDPFKQKVLKPIEDDKKISITLVVIKQAKKKSSWQKLKNNLRRGRGLYVLIMFFKNFTGSHSSNAQSLKGYCEEKGYEYIEIQNSDCKISVEEESQYSPDLGVHLGGFGIINKSILDAFPKGVLSYHHGDMRSYRGMPPAFWELYNNEDKMGVTVQKLNAGLDRGIPIDEMDVNIEQADTESLLRKRAFKKSIPMMHRAIKKINSPSFRPVKINNYGNIYTLPNFRQWFTLQCKIAYRKVIKYF